MVTKTGIPTTSPALLAAQYFMEHGTEMPLDNTTLQAQREVREGAKEVEQVKGAEQPLPPIPEAQLAGGAALGDPGWDSLLTYLSIKSPYLLITDSNGNIHPDPMGDAVDWLEAPTVSVVVLLILPECKALYQICSVENQKQVDYYSARFSDTIADMEWGWVPSPFLDNTPVLPLSVPRPESVDASSDYRTIVPGMCWTNEASLLYAGLAQAIGLGWIDQTSVQETGGIILEKGVRFEEGREDSPTEGINFHEPDGYEEDEDLEMDMIEMEAVHSLEEGITMHGSLFFPASCYSNLWLPPFLAPQCSDPMDDGFLNIPLILAFESNRLHKVICYSLARKDVFQIVTTKGQGIYLVTITELE